jgi:hypothetical protein
VRPGRFNPGYGALGPSGAVMLNLSHVGFVKIFARIDPLDHPSDGFPSLAQRQAEARAKL